MLSHVNTEKINIHLLPTGKVWSKKKKRKSLYCNFTLPGGCPKSIFGFTI